MSRNEQEIGQTADIDFSALEQELAQMAEETPDMPEDFHANWVKCVRDEAEIRRQLEAPEETDPAVRRKTEIRKQRRYLLSAAAAFILVIGIAILMQKLPDNPFTRVKTMPAATEQPADDSAPAKETGQPVPEPEAYPETAENEDEAAESAVTESTYTADSGSAAEAVYAGGASAKTAAVKSEERSGEAEEPAEAEAAYPDALYDSGYAAEEAEEAYFEAAAEDDPEEAEAEAETLMAAVALTAAPAESTAAPAAGPGSEPTAAPTAGPAAEPEAEPEAESGDTYPAIHSGKPTNQGTATEKAEETKAEGSSFLQQLWDGILMITPWVLGIVVTVLFLVTYVIRKKPHKRQ